MSILKKSVVGGLAISFMILSAINVFAATAADPTKQGDVVCRNNSFIAESDQRAQLGLYHKDSRGEGFVMQLLHTTKDAAGKYGLTKKTRWDTGQAFPSIYWGSFKDETTYWGAKYPGKGTADLLNVIKSARNQITKYPLVEWTDTSLATPGQTVRATRTAANASPTYSSVTIKPKFRSDTFVNWAHYDGNYGTTMVPTVAKYVAVEIKPKFFTLDYFSKVRTKYSYWTYEYSDSKQTAKDAWNNSTFKKRLSGGGGQRPHE